MWSGVRGVQCRQGNFRLEDRQLEGVLREDVQLKQHDPLIYVILTKEHAVKVFGTDGVQCGDEGGADPGDSLSREDEKVQTRGDLFPDISIDYVESQVRAFEYEIKETCEENKVFLLMEKG